MESSTRQLAYRRPFSPGFTLVEMAVVLVVLGLMVSGVMIGKNLVRAAELRAVVGETSQFVSAINQFSTKYKYLPGDFPKAETLWGSDAGCPSTPANASPKTATCNGDGEGHIESDALNFDADYIQETFRAWQHLANAGMNGGIYTGTQGPNDPLDTEIGINVPGSKLTGGGYMLYYAGTLTGAGDFFDGDYGHAMLFGAARDSAPTSDPIMNPSEALSLDMKMDDGAPASGQLLTFKSTSGNAPDCATADDTTATYDTTNGDRLCALVFKTGF